MNILLTGAYGFVGTNLCRYLVAKGHECLALDVPAAKRDDVPYAAFFTWDELDRIPAVDAVVHLAGKAHDTKNVTKPEAYFDINVGLTKRIFEAVREKVKAKGPGQQPKVRFVYFSSIKALDGDTPYAQSKRAAEEYLKEANDPTLAADLDLCVLEPAMIHGPGNKGNLNLLVQVVKKGIPWPLAAFANNRSFTSIGNICAVVEALCAHGPSGTYPMCDDTPVSTNRLIELISEAYGRKARLWKIPRGLMRAVASVGSVLRLPLNRERLGKLTEDSVVDNSRIKEALGWASMPVSAEDGLRETLKSFVEEK